MIEEIPNPSVVGPKIMIGCVCIGAVTGSIFLIVLLFVAGDIYNVIDSAAGCLLQIFKDATGNNAGSICLLIAFNAIISSSVVMLDISYGIPIAVNCLRGRTMLPERTFVLPNTLGWIANIIALTYISLTTVLFLFPPVLPATGSSMNYCVAAFGIILVISTFQWVIDGRKNFTGPRSDVDILAGVVEEVPTHAETAETHGKSDGK
ncbi:hypothetical protein APSETT444_008223 [Aspergillus pseudonomiae]